VVEPLNRIKGVAILGFPPTLNEVVGEGAWERVSAELDEPVRSLIGAKSILPSSWYDVAWYHALYVACERAGVMQRDLPWRVGLVSTTNDLTRGIYRMLMKVISPEFLLSRSGLVFNQYYETGKVRLTELRKGGGRARWEGCAGFTEHVWRDVAGGCEGGLIVAGAKEPRLTITGGGGDGDTWMDMEASWT
jgi:hypothetical protein